MRDVREARHPRSRAQVPRRRHRAVRKRSRLPQEPRGPRGAGDPVLRHGHRAARVPASREAVLRHDHPAGRQQVRGAQHRGVVGRLVHLRAAGCRSAMPLQAYFRINSENAGQFERTLIIADEGSQGPLHRGLLGAGVHERLAALGGRRDRRQAARPGHLHDHPELVAERLQPRHQAGPGRGGRPHGVDRRQHRLEAHDEVPGRLPGRPKAHGRGAVGRLRRCRPAPGRRGEDGPRRPEDDVEDRLQVDPQGRRHHHVPRAGACRRRCHGVQEPRAVRRADPRRGLGVEDAAVHGGRRA